MGIDMSQQERTKRLRKLMADHKLKAQDVGDIVGRTAQTVRGWACAYPKRAIPENTLRLLEHELAERAKANAAAPAPATKHGAADE